MMVLADRHQQACPRQAKVFAPRTDKPKALSMQMSMRKNNSAKSNKFNSYILGLI